MATATGVIPTGTENEAVAPVVSTKEIVLETALVTTAWGSSGSKAPSLGLLPTATVPSASSVTRFKIPTLLEVRLIEDCA